VTDFQFSVEDGTNSGQCFPLLFEEIESRLPRLTVLGMGGDLMASACSASLIALVSTLQHLEDYYYPRYGLTPRLFLALSHLPRLRRILAAIGKAPTSEHILELESMDSSGLSEGAFSSLAYLRIPANFRLVRNLLEHVHGPRALVSLTCDTLHYESPQEIRQLLTSIAVVCSQLQSLELSCIPANDQGTEPIACTWESLRPVLQCRSLVDLVIGHALPLDMTEKDLEELACDRPIWKVIKLAAFPSFHLSPRPTVGFSALLSFARHCPHLESLGLFIDENLRLPEIPPKTQFSALSKLELGFSPISEENVTDISWLLADMCVLPMTIETEWTGSLVVPTPAVELKDRASRWSRVQEFQNKVGKLRWIESLREENARLREQVAISAPEGRFRHLK